MTQSDIRVVVNEFDLDALGDDWETLVSAGIQIVEAHDRNRWTLGDLAKKCQRRYGSAAIKTYAAAVNVRSSTMYEYHACATFYNLEDRATFPPLAWSHYRAALRLKEHELALEWLARAADEEWSADTLTKEIKEFLGEDTPEKVFDQVKRLETDADGKTPVVFFDGSDLKVSKRYRVVLYEVEGEDYSEVQDAAQATST